MDSQETAIQAELDDALAEQNALLAQEHCGPLLKIAAKLGLPAYRLGSNLTIGGCMVAGGCIQRFGCVLYVFSIIIEPYEMGRVVSKIQVFDLNGLAHEEETGQGRTHRMFADSARGVALKVLFAAVATDRSRLLLAYERADIDELWKLTSAEINRRVSQEVVGAVGDEFTPEAIANHVSSFVFIPMMLKQGSVLTV